MRAFKETSPGQFVSWGNWGLQLGTGLFIFFVGLVFTYGFYYTAISGQNEPGIWIAYISPLICFIWGGYHLFVWKKITIILPKRKLIVSKYLFGILLNMRTSYLLEFQEITILTSKSVNGETGRTDITYRVQLDTIVCYETTNRRAAEENAEFLSNLLKLPVKSWLPSIDDWKKTPH